jgi:methionyl-tRNA formyltransferase
MPRPSCLSMKNNKKKVIFIGGLSNGKKVVQFLLSQKNLKVDFIFTHNKKKNIPRYSNFSFLKKKIKILKTNNVNHYYLKIKKYKPDIILVAGWSNIISEKILEIPKYGVVGFHPSDLPKDRGRSVLAWQIEEGYKKTALTMFYYTKKADAGDIIGKYIINIKKTDYVNDILDKVDFATIKLLNKYFKKLFTTTIKKIKQNKKKATYRKLRTYEDQLINWNDKGEKIINKIRAISNPYPGAIGFIKGKKYKIWKAKIVSFKKKGKKLKKTLLVKSKNCSILLQNYEIIK